MKTKTIYAISLAFLLSLSLFSFASAENSKNNINKEPYRDNATSVAANASTTNSKGETMSETHRSVVAAFVKSLLSVADRNGGIGAQVREIARTQNNSSSTTEAAIEKIEKRNSVKTFLLGSDYKNIGAIRRELATTTNNIFKLRKLLEQTNNAADRTEINNQISALQAEQEKITNFIKSEEGKFSLFGWFTKLFTK